MRYQFSDAERRELEELRAHDAWVGFSPPPPPLPVSRTEPRPKQRLTARLRPKGRYHVIGCGTPHASSACRACTRPTRGPVDNLCAECWQLVTPDEKARYLERWRASDMVGAAGVMADIAQRIRAQVSRAVVVYVPPAASVA